MRLFFSLLSGALFGAGLYISGMTDTNKMQGWLDVFGAWDPTLAFVMGGAILPMGPIVQYTGQRPLDPITLLISLDEHGEARGELFEDDGDGFAYREGDCLRTVYAAKRVRGHVNVWVEQSGGGRPRPLRAAEIVVLLDDGRLVRATGVGGDTISVLVAPPPADPIEPGGLLDD